MTACICPPRYTRPSGKIGAATPTAEWPPALEGYVYSQGTRATSSAKQQDTKRQSGISWKEIKLLPTYQPLFTHQKLCTFYYVFCLLMDELESTNLISALLYSSSSTAVIFCVIFGLTNRQTHTQLARGLGQKWVLYTELFSQPWV